MLWFYYILSVYKAHGRQLEVTMVLFRAIKVFRYIFQLYPEQTVIFNPTIKELSRAIQTLVGEEMMSNAYIIVLDSLVLDEFFDETSDKGNRLG